MGWNPTTHVFQGIGASMVTALFNRRLAKLADEKGIELPEDTYWIEIFWEGESHVKACVKPMASGGRNLFSFHIDERNPTPLGVYTTLSDSPKDWDKLPTSTG